MDIVRLRAFGAACAALSLAGCGGGSDDRTATAWDRVHTCFANSGMISKLDGVPPTGTYAPPDVMPLNFGDAPGGWLIADMARSQRLAVFFYGDTAEAKRAEEGARSPDTRPGGAMGNVIYVFDQQPTSEESGLLKACLDTPAGS
jgi:hypothetical protein